MKLNSTVLLISITILMLMVSIVSCKKAKLNRDTTTSEDNQLAESVFDDMFNVVDKSADEENLDGSGKGNGSSGGLKLYSDSCVDVSLIPAAWDTITDTFNDTFPKTLTIDFGDEYCVGEDGKSRKGRIIAVFTGRYREPGTEVTITPEDYYVDDYKVEGEKIVTNITEVGGNSKFEVDVNGKVITPEGDEIVWESLRYREWIEGESTGFWSLRDNGTCCKFFQGILDDVWEVTGSGSGINRHGRAFTVDISTPLRIEYCDWIPQVTEGLVEIQPEDLRLRTVDFGDKTCDGKATVTIGRREFIINLR